MTTRIALDSEAFHKLVAGEIVRERGVDRRSLMLRIRRDPDPQTGPKWAPNKGCET
jgi:hypothetical protein